LFIGMDNEYVSVREAARQCGRNPETIRRWVWSGKLPAEKLGNQLFIKRSDLVNYCRETTIQKYQTGRKPDFLERAIALQERIRARGGKPIDAAELIRKMREERMNELQQNLR
jgi:excisionase family DNA binding protein